MNSNSSKVVIMVIALIGVICYPATTQKFQVADTVGIRKLNKNV